MALVRSSTKIWEGLRPLPFFLNSHHHAHGRRSWSTSAYFGSCPLAIEGDRLYVPLEERAPSAAATFRVVIVADAPGSERTDALYKRCQERIWPNASSRGGR